MPIRLASQAVEERMKSLLADSAYNPAETTLMEQEKIRDRILPLLDEPLKEALLHMHLMADYLPERIFLPKEGDSYINQPAHYTPMKLHAHEYYEAFYLEQGCCMHFIGSHALRMEAGDFVMIPPGVYHMPALLTDTCTAYSIGLRSSTVLHTMYHLIQTGTYIGRFFIDTFRAQATDGYLLYHCRSSLQRLTALLELTAAQAASPPMATPLLFAYHTALLELSFLQMEQAITPEFCLDIQDGTPARRIARYIETHFATVTKEELSRVFSYSERQISRFVKEATGGTFKDYLAKVRIHYICDMLLHTSVPTGEIILSSGYQNNNVYYNLFRTRTGMTPSEYRNRAQKTI